MKSGRREKGGKQQETLWRLTLTLAGWSGKVYIPTQPLPSARPHNHTWDAPLVLGEYMAPWLWLGARGGCAAGGGSRSPKGVNCTPSTSSVFWILGR